MRVCTARSTVRLARRVGVPRAPVLSVISGAVTSCGGQTRADGRALRRRGAHARGPASCGDRRVNGPACPDAAKHATAGDGTAPGLPRGRGCADQAVIWSRTRLSRARPGRQGRPGHCNRSVPHPVLAQDSRSGAPAGVAAEEGGLSCPGQVGQRSSGAAAGICAPGGSWAGAVRACVSGGTAAGTSLWSCPRRRAAGVGGSGWAATPPALPRRRHLAGWANRAARRAAVWPAVRRGSGWRPGWPAGSR